MMHCIFRLEYERKLQMFWRTFFSFILLFYFFFQVNLDITRVVLGNGGYLTSSVLVCVCV